MRERKSRLITMLVVIFMLASLFVGCGGGEGAETTDPSAIKFDADGYVFQLGNAGGFDPAANPGTSIASELKAIYAKIENDFNCKIEFYAAPDGFHPNEEIMSSVTGNTKFVDFIRVRQSSWIPLGIGGYIYALDSEELSDAGLELNNKDVFFQHYTHLADFNGHTWAVDMSGKYYSMAFGHTYAFNKRLTEEAGYSAETLYKAVYDMKWDYDLFLEVAKKVQNNDDPENVIWGVALDCDGNEIWTNGPGPIIFKDGKWVENTKADNVQEVLQFMANINDKGALSPPLYDPEGAVASRGARRTLFYSGQAAFAGLYGPNFGYDGPTNGTGNMADPAGLLPIPKGPQSDKYTMNFVDVDTYAMPKSVKEIEKSARIMSAIGRAVSSEKEYYDFLYYERMMEDDDAYKILTEYLLPGGLLNIAKCSDDMYDITRYAFYADVYDGQKTPIAAAEFYAPQIQAELDKVMNK